MSMLWCQLSNDVIQFDIKKKTNTQRGCTVKMKDESEGQQEMD
jgi:hypothetical protein